jgi:UDP-N-acetylmuramoyl-tripeptide--D-alanyl-D-alanine ligase
MPLWSSSEATEATGGLCSVTWSAEGISIDTRTINPGDLFIALTDRRDGHDFVAQALLKGAAAALVSYRPANVDENAPLLIVKDVMQGLNALGQAARSRTNARIIAVTGSVGKTSTKEMLKTVLEFQGRTHASIASYNNHWGVPLSLASMPRDTEFGIFEIGMNHPGEIAPLSRITRPHVGMITSIAPAHMEAFNGIDAIAVEKAEIFAGLNPNGVAVLPADVGTVDILVQGALRKNATILGFGEKADAYRLIALKPYKDVTVIQAQLRGAPVVLKINAVGHHFAMNALGVLAAVEALAGDPGRAAVDIFRWKPSAGRGRREVISLNPDKRLQEFELIDDAYNANPASMAAALQSLASIVPSVSNTSNRTSRKIAILGDMLELGTDEIKYHISLAKNLHLRNLDVVHCVGLRMRACYNVLPVEIRGDWVETADEFKTKLHTMILAGDIVLVKGSLGSKVSTIVDLIRNLGQR